MNPHDWIVFDPDLPPPLPKIPEDEGRVVVLAATTEAILRGWAPDVAMALARAWTRRGEKVVLVDAGLGSPALHQIAGVPNTEGLADAMLYGGSLRRSAIPLEDGDLFLVTAGTVTAEPTAMLGGERWQQLCEGFMEGGVTLVVYVPAEEPWHTSVLERATDVVYMATANDTPVDRIGYGDRVRAVVGVSPAPPDDEGADDFVDPLAADPLGLGTEALPVEELDLGPALDPLREALVDDDPLAEPELPVHVATDPGDTTEPAFEPGRPEPAAGPTPSVAARPATSRGRRGLLALVTVVAVAALAAVSVQAGWLGLGSESEAGVEGPAASTPAGAASTATPAVAKPTPASPSPRYGFALASYRDAALAAARMESLTARVVDTWFALVPVEVGAIVFTRLIAGLAPDSMSAEGMRAELGSSIGEDAGAWIVRGTRLAFELGDFDAPAAAAARVDELIGQDVPAYVLAVEYSDESIRYRVYAGGYATEDEAAYLGRVLTRLGLPATITERVGTLPPR